MNPKLGKQSLFVNKVVGEAVVEYGGLEAVRLVDTGQRSRNSSARDAGLN